MASDEAYHKLIALLDEYGATYRVIEHEPEGVTEAVSRLRGMTRDRPQSAWS